jgi:hypothetical protein
MPHTNLHKVINLAKVHMIILQGLDIFTKKDTKHAFHLKWSDQPCWAKFLSRIIPLSERQMYLLVKGESCIL